MEAMLFVMQALLRLLLLALTFAIDELASRIICEDCWMGIPYLCGYRDAIFPKAK